MTLLTMDRGRRPAGRPGQAGPPPGHLVGAASLRVCVWKGRGVQAAHPCRLLSCSSAWSALKSPSPLVTWRNSTTCSRCRPGKGREGQARARPPLCSACPGGVGAALGQQRLRPPAPAPAPLLCTRSRSHPTEQAPQKPPLPTGSHYVHLTRSCTCTSSCVYVAGMHAT